MAGAWEDITGRPAGTVRTRPRFFAETAGACTCHLGAPVVADESFDSKRCCEVVIATDLVLEPNCDPRGRWPAAGGWLRDQYERGATVCSVCTGSVLLAEAGLLDGLEATTHWSAVPLFRTFYPQVRLAPAKIVARAGPEHRIITSGGHAAWSDLALYLIARYCGQEEAVRTSKLFLLGDHRDGQLPFAAMVKPAPHDDGVIGECQVWIARHYALPNPVARMTRNSGLPARTFKRRFSAATGYTPIGYVQTLRIEEAKHLLETTASPVDEIGEQVGYADGASFRRIFRRMTGVTPARYRARFGSIGRNAAGPTGS